MLNDSITSLHTHAYIMNIVTRRHVLNNNSNDKANLIDQANVSKSTVRTNRITIDDELIARVESDYANVGYKTIHKANHNTTNHN